MDIRPARPEDTPAIIATLRAAFGTWHGEESDAYWEWKFERNPHGRAHIWVGDDAGAIAGCYMWNPVRLRRGASLVRGAQSVDAAVHPDYQGRGLFTELARAALEDATCDVELVYAFPTEGAYRGQLRVGFEDLFPVGKLHRPLLVRPGRRTASAAGLRFRDVRRFDSRFDVFSANGAFDGLTVSRDAAYLQWRYAEHPSGAHETIACERDGELRAYCVLTVDASGGRAAPGYLVDLQALPDAADDARHLVRQALARLRERGSRIAVAWTRPSGAEQGALESLGFSPLYRSAWRRLARPSFVDRFIVLDTGRGTASTAGAKRWSLVPGDADYT